MRLLDLVVAVDDAKRVRELHIALLSCEYRVESYLLGFFMSIAGAC